MFTTLIKIKSHFGIQPNRHQMEALQNLKCDYFSGFNSAGNEVGNREQLVYIERCMKLVSKLLLLHSTEASNLVVRT